MTRWGGRFSRRVGDRDAGILRYTLRRYGGGVGHRFRRGPDVLNGSRLHGLDPQIKQFSLLERQQAGLAELRF